jgi:hypothetical protein
MYVISSSSAAAALAAAAAADAATSAPVVGLCRIDYARLEIGKEKI